MVKYVLYSHDFPKSLQEFRVPKSLGNSNYTPSTFNSFITYSLYQHGFISNLNIHEVITHCTALSFKLITSPTSSRIAFAVHIMKFKNWMRVKGLFQWRELNPESDRTPAKKLEIKMKMLHSYYWFLKFGVNTGCST